MDPILEYFEFSHLPEKLQAVSQPFYQMAHHLDLELVNCEEKSVALRKLLESKDCAVRAALKNR